MTEKQKKRGKYGRPCDLCSSRRVRCIFTEGSRRCEGCISHSLECTYNRVRKRTGPKGKNEQASQPPPVSFMPLPAPPPIPRYIPTQTNTPSLSAFQHFPDPYVAVIPLDRLVTYLHIYQTWFYGYWPVLSVAEMILKITNTDLMSSNSIRLGENNAFQYSLACSVCAAIATQMKFVSAKDRIINEASTYDDTKFAEEAKRVRNLFDYAICPTVETVLSSFFLYAHYTNCIGKTNQAIIYLREAISVAQLLGFHDPSTYVNKPAAIKHRWQKIYYTLLVTERFMCFENGMPVILDPRIELPLLENEEYPSVLVGFIELAKVFSVPNKMFFEEVHSKNTKQRLEAFKSFISANDEVTTIKYILEVQSKLSLPIEHIVRASDSQKLNIILSRSWIQAIAWHIAYENGLLANSQTGRHECFTRGFPLKIATDFLATTRDLPDVAFEANGPGVSVKLLEIANSLTLAKPLPDTMWLFADCLKLIFELVNRFKSDMTLVDVYNKVAGTIYSLQNSIERPLARHTGSATISELREEDEVNTPPQDSLTGQGSLVSYTQSGRDTPFSQMIREMSNTESAYSREIAVKLYDESENGALGRDDQWSMNSPLLSSFMHPQC